MHYPLLSAGQLSKIARDVASEELRELAIQWVYSERSILYVCRKEVLAGGRVSCFVVSKLWPDDMTPDVEETAQNVNI